MFGGQPLECAPAHPLRLVAFAVQDAWLPPQLRPKPVSPPCRASTRILVGTGAAELIAVPAGEDAAAVEDRQAATSWTGAAGGLAAQPIFEPVQPGLIRGQAAPLIAAHVAQREAVFECPAFQLDSQSLRRPQLISLSSP